jgi:hypothetical protein
MIEGSSGKWADRCERQAIAVPRKKPRRRGDGRMTGLDAAGGWRPLAMAAASRELVDIYKPVSLVTAD